MLLTGGAFAGGRNMKKVNVMKTIQMIILIVFTVICAYLIFFQENLYHQIAEDPATRLVCALLWICLILSYVFILFDFILTTSFKKNYRKLYGAAHSDPSTGLANRNSCDAILEKYQNKPLPDNIGCVMFDITNIKEINEAYGYAEGNILIQDFSNILKMAMLGLCFVGRNGGNKFLAIFENCDQDKIDRFLMRLDMKVKDYNSSPTTKTIKYSYGVAFREGSNVKTITELVALSNSRIYEDK